MLATHSRMPPHYAESAGLYTEIKSDGEREREREGLREKEELKREKDGRTDRHRQTNRQT